MNTEAIGGMIRKIREQKGQTQVRLAELLNVSDKTVSKWETGRGLPDVTLFPKLAAALGVSVTELMNGAGVTNGNRAGNMLRSKLYVCPMCGNVILSAGEALISCCGGVLKSLVPQEPDEPHAIEIERTEDQYHVTMKHEMSKAHSIAFLAAVSDNGIHLTKLYAEQNAEAWFPIARTRMVYAYCTQHGLYRLKP